jgi:DNA polymerase (family 10)
VKNLAIADLFSTMADVMEIKGENAFRVNTYRRVARTLHDLTGDIEQIHADGRLQELEGIGESSAAKIAEFIETGKIEAYAKLLEGFPSEALEMLKIPTIGPKTVARLLNEKGIKTVDGLAEAIDRGELAGMPGIREKSIENIKAGIEFLRRSSGRTLLWRALTVAEGVVDALREACDLQAVEPAGSLRRMKETIGDVDILATVKARGRRAKGSDPDDVPGGAEVVEAFTKLPMVEEALAAGGTKGSVRTQSGLQVDLRVVRPESFGAALVYFTGSKEHNIRIRGTAQRKDLKINEYGVFRGETLVAGKTEEEVYKMLELPWIPPELREDRGEVEAAAEGELPELVTLDDIRSDLHMHSDYSDGSFPVVEMARATKEMGYSYIAITDHSPSLNVAQGLSVKRLRKQQKEIDEANEELGGFTVLKGTEADILADGSVDYPPKVLKGMDLVIASVHSHFNMSEQEMTERICKAAANPLVHAIGHLTGRLLGQRDSYALNVGAVIEACAEHGTALEINAHTERLDITDLVCREAKAAGVKVIIGTDAHHTRHLPMMRLGVAVARRGWLEKSDVLNCLTVKQFLKWAGRG